MNGTHTISQNKMGTDEILVEWISGLDKGRSVCGQSLDTVWLPRRDHFYLGALTHSIRWELMSKTRMAPHTLQGFFFFKKIFEQIPRQSVLSRNTVSLHSRNDRHISIMGLSYNK
jgi:hypothetical protein